MEEAPGIDFRPTAAQRRLLDDGGKQYISWGQGSGRHCATEVFIVATAATPADARACLEDLRQHGIAFLSSKGKRVEPPRRNGARFACIRFDKEKK